MLQDQTQAAIEAAVEDVKAGDQVKVLYVKFVEALIARVNKPETTASELEVVRRFLHGKRMSDGRENAPEKKLHDDLPYESVEDEVL